MADQNVDELAAMIYGEVSNKDFNTMVRVGSTALNRVDYGGEFGTNLIDVIHSERSPYYAVKNQNDPYVWAKTGKFPDFDSENNYKMARQAAYGLVSGRIDRTRGLFMITPKEEARMRKQGKKVFNFDLTEKVDSDDTYNYLDYKRKK